MQKKVKRKAGIFLMLLACMGVCAGVNQFYTEALVAEDGEIIYIATASDLIKLEDAAYAGKTLKLTNDIDLGADLSWQERAGDPESGWLPLDTFHQSGCVFDGGGFTISNLLVDRPLEESAGLFSRNSIAIKNLFISTAGTENAGTYDIRGGTAGVLAAENYGTLENVHVTGTVFGTDSAGGLAAINYGDCNNCSFNGNVSGRVTGGIAAINESKSFRNLYAKGNAEGHIAGGLAGVLYNNFVSSEIDGCFADMEVRKTAYDETATRIGAFAGTREDGIAVTNCYSADSAVSVAYGAANGITTLTEEERQQKESFAGFDFRQYWHFDNGIKQRTIAVASNTVYMGLTPAAIVGDRAYYLPGEIAELTLFTGDSKNIGLLSATLNGEPLAFTEGKASCVVSRQLNVNFNAAYLLHVELNGSVLNGTLKSDREYYFPGETIIVEVVPDPSFQLDKLKAVFNGDPVEFTELGGGKYKIELLEEAYSDTATLYIDGVFIASGAFDWMILAWVAIGILIILCIVGILLLLRWKKMKRREGKTNEKVRKPETKEKQPKEKYTVKVDKVNGRTHYTINTGILRKISLTQLFYISLGFLFFGILLTHFIYLQFYTAGTFVIGRVVKSEVSGGLWSDEHENSDNNVTDYEYTVDGKTYYGSRWTVKLYEKDDEIIIRYQNSAPGKSTVLLGVNFEVTFILLLIMLVAIVLAVIYKKARKYFLSNGGQK